MIVNGKESSIQFSFDQADFKENQTYEQSLKEAMRMSEVGLMQNKVPLQRLYEMQMFNAQRRLQISGTFNSAAFEINSVSEGSLTTCGDGVVSANEQCDLGNLNSDDGSTGCTTQCQVEMGWECNESSCFTSIQQVKQRVLTYRCQYSRAFNDDDYGCCGDGFISSGESCDDGLFWNQNQEYGRCQQDCTYDYNYFDHVYSLSYSGYTYYSVAYDSAYYQEKSWCGDRSVQYNDYGSGWYYGDGWYEETCDDFFNLYMDGCTDCEPDLECVCSSGTTLGASMSVCTCQCGDGYYNENWEECDDGNRMAFDGCSPTCKIEYGYESDGEGGAQAICGDGLVRSGEECDDGNTVDGDGCYSDCSYVEDGYYCPNEGGCFLWELCGDGYLDTNEVCDTGDVYDDYCISCSYVIDGFYCTGGNSVRADECYDYWSNCGNGVINYSGDTASETCDDGNEWNGDGCSGCQIDSGWVCPFPDEPCIKLSTCGNGIRDQGEACDDGNNLSHDGCHKDCSKVSTNWICYGADMFSGPDGCYEIPETCGDGNYDDYEVCDSGDGCYSCRIMLPMYYTDDWGETVYTCGDGDYDYDLGEECDDGDNTNGDGCSEICRIEYGYVCPDDGDGCTKCGNGNINSGESCDDGNSDDDDGCSSSCSIESGYECTDYWNCTYICGNGDLDSGEECDDANYGDGDGCSSACEVEDGYYCYWISDPDDDYDYCYRLCGDGYYTEENYEGCDDGNNDDGDGCSSDCSVESYWECDNTEELTSTCELKCGNGSYDTSDSYEECDDGNWTNGDGCSSGCKIEDGYECPAPNHSSCNLMCGNGAVDLDNDEECDTTTGCDTDTCLPLSGYECDSDLNTCNLICGNGVRDDSEECDDGNYDNDDGCYECQVIDGWYCEVILTVETCSLYCTNGEREVDRGEECDDGNYVDSDGCSNDCTIDLGYHCSPSSGIPGDTDTCEMLCGNGKRNYQEKCDDGNLVSGDGCYNCKIEEFYSCSGGSKTAADTCHLTCTNGLVETGEICDDGNSDDTDGCPNTCDEVTQGYTCTGGSTSSASTCIWACGNAKLEASSTEVCDDGNYDTDDGCDDYCLVEDGWTCTGGSPNTRSVCKAICGDGELYGVETCDDGNTVSSDGCSSTCQTENGYTCDTPGAACTTVCGDGYRTSDEECDDDNDDDDDGCSSDCIVEQAYACTGGSTTSADTCTALDQDGDVYSGTLDDCESFVDSWFMNTCTGSTVYDNINSYSSSTTSCTNPSSTVSGSAVSNKACNSAGGSCTQSRRFCATCSRKNGLTYIRIQSDTTPDYCVFSDTYWKSSSATVTNWIDFEIMYSPTWIGDRSSFTVSSQSSLDSLRCSLRASSSRFPGGGVNTKIGLTYKNDQSDKMYVGVTFNGVAIYPGLYNGQDAFNPQTGTALNKTVDHCLGYVDHSNGQPIYKYYAYSPCMFFPDDGDSVKYATPSICGATSSCYSDPILYSYTETVSESEVINYVGIAKDGYMIIGPYDEDGELFSPSDLDICNGIVIGDVYYYVTSKMFPYTVGCWGPGPSVTSYAPTCSIQASYYSTVSGSHTAAAGNMLSFNGVLALIASLALLALML